jgi:hypothetical protein
LLSLAVAILVIEPITDPASPVPRNATTLDPVLTLEKVSTLTPSQISEQPCPGRRTEKDAPLARFSINEDCSLSKVHVFKTYTDDLADPATG